MSKRIRKPGEPGRYMPTMDHSCGFDGGDDSAEVCGQTATLHIFAGSPEDGPSDWATFSCSQHSEQAKHLAFDWHDVSAVCDVPGTRWMSRNAQGEGFCYWPEVEAVQAEQLQQIEAAK